MATVGFNFTKISAEKHSIQEPNVKVDNNVGITDIIEASMPDNKKTIVKFQFQFLCKYDPGLGFIELKGELIEIYEKDIGVKIVEGWKADKRVPPEIMQVVLNTILTKANIEAIVISRELNLPSPVALPKVDVKPRHEEVKSKPETMIKVEDKPKAEEKSDKKKK